MVEAALGISAELLVNRQARYNMAVSLKEKSLTDKLHDFYIRLFYDKQNDKPGYVVE